MISRERLRITLDWASPILLGLLVAVGGLLPWMLMAPVNARILPEVPWAAGATLLYLFVYLAWLHGAGPPGRWTAARRYRLRLWRTDSNAWSGEGLGLTLTLLAAIAGLTLLWILVGAPAQPPDMSAYPTTAYRVSLVVMTPLVAGVVEEAAYRGYMQRGLERFGAGHAIVVSAAVFALAHGVHGLATLLLIGPGIFIAGVVYGLLARHTGSILPGMAAHFFSDLAYTYFGLLGGDGQLLRVG